MPANFQKNSKSYNHKYFSDIQEYKINIEEFPKKHLLIDLYELMKKLRLYEIEIKEQYHPADRMRCPVHLCIGQEAIPAALFKLTEQGDYIFSHHRSHGYYFASKSNMKYLISELHGKNSGASGGLAGSQDISSAENNFYSGAILGGTVGIASGVAASIKLSGTKQKCVVGFGEACTEEGVFWETINFAALENLPILFICENNKYATYSNQLKRQPKDNITEKVSAFGVKSRKIFGNDITEVYSVINNSLQEIASKKTPIFIEAYTYRMNSHVGPEDDNYNNYRDESEMKKWSELCPIKLLEEALLRNKIIDIEYIERIEKEIKELVKKDFDYSLRSEFPQLISWDELNYNRERSIKHSEFEEISNIDHNQNETKITNY